MVSQKAWFGSGSLRYPIMILGGTPIYLSTMVNRIDAQERRSRIVRSAFRVLARDGLEGLTMRRVAMEAGCTIGLVNHWFASKEDLVLAAWKESVRLENARGSQLRAEGRFEVCAALLDSLPTSPDMRRKELVGIAFAAAATSNERIRRIYALRYRNARRLLSRALTEDGVNEKESKEIADLLIGATVGISTMATLDRARWPAARQRQALRRLIEPLLNARCAVARAKEPRIYRS